MAPDKRGSIAGHIPLPSIFELLPLPIGARTRGGIGERGAAVWPHPGLALQGQEADSVRVRRGAFGHRGRRDTLPLGHMNVAH